MEIKELNKLIESLLSRTMGKRESSQVTRWLLEDAGLNPGEHGFEVDQANVDALMSKVDELIVGKPFDYVVGNSVFYGRKFIVNDHVLIPRPETEELVEACIRLLRKLPGEMKRVLDIGTGSGVIPVTMALECPGVQMEALDVSEAAIDVAQANAQKYGVGINFRKHDILDPSGDDQFGTYDMIVSNPPYIGDDERGKMSPSTLRYEPSLALFAPGADPLIFYRRITRFSQAHLLEGGMVCLEMNEYRSLEIKDIFLDAGFSRVEILQDIQGKDRILLVWK